MIINHNISALNAHRQLGANQGATQNSLEKLSSGLRINKAGDDAAGLAISEKMRGQIKGLEMASKNAQDGISLIQTAEGALNETHSILQRMRELAVQSSNDTNNDADRAELQKEVDQLAQEITRISENTEFNTKNLLGENGFEGKFHIGANAGQDIDLKINDMGAEALEVLGKAMEEGEATIGSYDVKNANGEAISIELVAPTGDGETQLSSTFEDNKLTITLAKAAKADGGAITTTHANVIAEINKIDGLTAELAENVTGTEAASAVTSASVAAATESDDYDPTKGINISTQEKASEAITTINTAIETVSAERSKLGAVQNRLEHTINNLGASAENLTAAESRIRDVDYDLAAA